MHGQEHCVLSRAVPVSNDCLVHALYCSWCMPMRLRIYVSKTATSAQHYTYLACMRSIGWMAIAMMQLLRLGLCGSAMVDSDRFLSELFSAEFRHCCSEETTGECGISRQSEGLVWTRLKCTEPSQSSEKYIKVRLEVTIATSRLHMCFCVFCIDWRCLLSLSLLCCELCQTYFW